MPKCRLAWRLVMTIIAITSSLVGAGAAHACGGMFQIQADRGTLVVPSGGTVSIKEAAGNLQYDIGDTGQWTVLFAANHIDVDFDGCAGTVVLDGTTGPISMVTSIYVRNGSASSQLRVKGTIKTTDTSGVISIAATVPTQLIGATTFEGNAAEPGVTFLNLAGPIDGAYPLTIAYGNAGKPGLSTVELTGGIGATTPPTTLDVDAGSARVVGTVRTSDVQTWSSSTSLVLKDADATLRAPRVTQLGTVECETCTATRQLTFDVTEVSPGSTFNDFGSGTTGPDADEWRYQLVKDGVGTLSYGLRAHCSRYTGGTVVNAGTLRVTDANALSTGPVSVGAAGTLALVGVDVGGLGAAVTPSSLALAGTLRSTDGASTMRVPITLTGDATIVAVDDAPLEVTAAIPGDGHVLSLAGPVNLVLPPDTLGAVRLGADSTWTADAVDLQSGALDIEIDSAAVHSRAVAQVGAVRLPAPALHVHVGTGLADGTSVVVIDQQQPGAVVGQFAGLAEGATVTPVSGSGTFRISYVGGDGNDVALTYVSDTRTPSLRARKPTLAAHGTLKTHVAIIMPGVIRQTAVIVGAPRAGHPRYCSARRTDARAGSYVLTCRPSKAMRARLRHGALKLRVTTTFVPIDGRAVSSVALVTVPRMR